MKLMATALKEGLNKHLTFLPCQRSATTPAHTIMTSLMKLSPICLNHSCFLNMTYDGNVMLSVIGVCSFRAMGECWIKIYMVSVIKLIYTYL